MPRLRNTGKFQPNRGFDKNFNEDGKPSAETVAARLQQYNENNKIDALYDFEAISDMQKRTGFLINMHATEIVEEDARPVSAVDYYFVQQDGSRFKVPYAYQPYFYILCRKHTTGTVSTFLRTKYKILIQKVDHVYKDDLDLPNHLVGVKDEYLKLYFANTFDLTKVRRELMTAVRENKEREKGRSFYTELLSNLLEPTEVSTEKSTMSPMENILDIREYDVPHHVRVSIDAEIFCGTWYDVVPRVDDHPLVHRRKDLLEPPDIVILAYDIETTKAPLKFPDSRCDKIMMISYMIDGNGYLITNREIISEDVESFEYEPKPEFHSFFTVFNELNEKLLIRKFFDHILEVKPHIFVTYNGDFFDWPFVEARAAVHNLNMKDKIGYFKNRESVYTSRPSIHMDCLSWVRRDSYLPVGSQGLKAVAKAKLRYNPVEINPEDMYQLASSDPILLANYSVSDAVATYYLYQKYVHPFIFALCTIIPMEPEEVLRKGSGTLCESLLMVEAFKANVIFPNKQQTELNKLTKDGHLLEQETYVGGHVEALESGVFRADIPCRFKIEPSAVDQLLDGVDNALKHAIQVEEKIPLDMVENFEEVSKEIQIKLKSLRDQPLRLENPVIYHLDVGAMYPNIILTNRLQPSAMVDDKYCAACDYNGPNVKCQRKMQWMWRGEYLAANLAEYRRVQRQLQEETFPPRIPGEERRTFQQLTDEEKAAQEKKRLAEYCRMAYKKVKITRMEERTQTVCQKENSFYVDAVRAFRDRRYEYKALTKVAKQEVAQAMERGDPALIKSAKNREILYDSLQLAHKCILNSFYGYVMRKGSRWHSMEMGGIVCYTGAHIIMKARELIEKIGRPLELDTDGIWCVLPASFPDNVIVRTKHPKKSKLVVSYPNAVLNFMVKSEFTNDVYHELVDPEHLTYEVRSENSIFFEVDGPYLAMVLPAAKEEGKKLKKRYAVFNFDGSLAELKGFEVKRRGELQLIKNFQTSVFHSFLKGQTLEECYTAVAKDANFWLDMLYSKCIGMPDSELFELISENKSMSRKLEDYGAQKSTSISTAKRLAEFLGEQMVKDAGLACNYIIANKPVGAPVTERAIPLAIFQSEITKKTHYLQKWLKDPFLASEDIRDILDWDYYIERLGSAIQKIITIPAALQGVANPVPRVQHPEWLHNKMLEKSGLNKQRKITDLFSLEKRTTPQESVEVHQVDDAETQDIEDLAGSSTEFKRPMATVSKRKRQNVDEDDVSMHKSWREALGSPPPTGKTKEERKAWLNYQKQKWAYQAKQRAQFRNRKRSRMLYGDTVNTGWGVVRSTRSSTLNEFFRRNQRKLHEMPWEIIQILPIKEPGMFRLWALVGQDLYNFRLVVPRVFYVNVRKERSNPGSNELWRKTRKILPRCRPVYNLYEYTVPEAQFQKHSNELRQDMILSDIEGIYETKVPLEFRAILHLGCVCTLNPFSARKIAEGQDTFSLDQLEFKSMAVQSYLREKDVLKKIFLYHQWSTNHQRALWGLFLGPSKKAHIFILDTATSNQLGNMNTLYKQERNSIIMSEGREKFASLPDELKFSISTETDFQQVCRGIQRALKAYQDERLGATILILQTAYETEALTAQMPLLIEFPTVHTHIRDVENLYNTLDWQRVGAKVMIQHYLKCHHIINLMTEQCRYFHAPIGNMPADAAVFGADLFFARHLQKENCILWCSGTGKPDFGGSETDDNGIFVDLDEFSHTPVNFPGTYSSICVQFDIEHLAINTLLQHQQINNESTNMFSSFNNIHQASVQGITTNAQLAEFYSQYDESVLCGPAFKVLRKMVNAWLVDVTTYKNVFADFQLIHFYRWLRSYKSLLYDPGLSRVLYTYMSKLFLHLVAEFKTLGCVLICANFNKIIVCTKKRLMAEAISYMEFVVQSIRNKELFHSIDISFEQCWEYVIWLDTYNFAAITSKASKEAQLKFIKLKKIPKSDNENDDDNNDDSNEDDDDDEPSISMNWYLTEGLPKEASCRASFNAIIAGYISAIYQFMCKSEPVVVGSTDSRKNRNFHTTATPSFGLETLKNTATYAKKLMSEDLLQTLFQLVEKIHAKLPEKVLTFKENPNLYFDGQDSKLIIPALELIKSICEVLSLDKELENDAFQLKSELLRLIKVHNFTDVSEFKDPCMSLILPDVMCPTCNHTRNVDLCRDVNVEDDEHKWNCPLCQTCYDTTQIERMLIEMVNRKCMGYVLQDIQCVKCHEIKNEELSGVCKCATELKGTVTRHRLIKFVRTCKCIAKTCKMSILEEMMETIAYFPES